MRSAPTWSPSGVRGCGRAPLLQMEGRRKRQGLARLPRAVGVVGVVAEVEVVVEVVVEVEEERWRAMSPERDSPS